MSQLSLALARPMMAQVYKQAVIKYNARRDDVGYMQKQHSRNPLFKGEELKGQISDQDQIEPDGVFAFVLTNTANTGGSQRFASGGYRGVGTPNISVPVMTSLNNMEGATAEELAAQIQPIGVVEQGNKDNGESFINVLGGGSMSVFYNGLTHAPLGCYFMVYPPSPAEAAEMRSPDPAVRGSRGVVRLLMKVYNPHTLDYFGPLWIMTSMVKLYSPDGGAGVLNLNDRWNTATAKLKEENSAPAMVDRLLRSIFDLANLGVRLGGDISTRADGAYQEFVKRVYAALEIYHTHSVSDEAAAVWTAGGARPSKDDVRKLANTYVSTINSFIQSMAWFKLEKERFILMKNSHASLVNATADVQITHYCA